MKKLNKEKKKIDWQNGLLAIEEHIGKNYGDFVYLKITKKLWEQLKEINLYGYETKI